MIDKNIYHSKLFQIERELDNCCTSGSLSFSLFDGLSGISLFYYTLYTATQDCRYLDKSIHLLNESVSIFDGCHFLPTYCGGLAGLSSLMTLLVKEGAIEYSVNDDVNEYLLAALEEYLNAGIFDFLHGAIGIATYFAFLLSVKPSNQYAIKATELTLERLNTTKEEGDATYKWRYYDRDGSFEYNISMAHGMSSIVCYLSRLLHIGYSSQTRIEDLCRRAIEYINSQRIELSIYGSFYPYTSLENNTSITKSRLAWCYGDLGIAIAQINAGLALRDSHIIDSALSVLMYVASQRRELKSNCVLDAGLCHGAAGIAQCFNRLFQLTESSIFKEATDYWMNVLLDFSDGEKYAGYIVFNPRGESYYSAGLLEGICGIGLSLISYLYPQSYKWDEIMNIV